MDAEARGAFTPRGWWWLLEAAGTVAMAGVAWFAGGGQTAPALLWLAAVVVIGGLLWTIKLVALIDGPAKGLWRLAVAPGLLVIAILARQPIVNQATEIRFSQAEKTLTAAAIAYLENHDAAIPTRAGSFTITEREPIRGGVVFYADGVGPLILDSCGFAYLPGGGATRDRIRGDWYWYC